MSAKHTPGPWAVAVNGRGTMLVSTPRDYIAEVFTGSPADGALLAAAPDMLAALLAVNEYLADMPLMDPTVTLVRAAIAKATQS